jgi:heme/copper-type cytochrome/quinol oxidase subunit 1
MPAYAPVSVALKCIALLLVIFSAAAGVATTGNAADLRLQLRQPLPQERRSSAFLRDELFKEFLIWLKKRNQR